MNILDSSAWIEYFIDGPNADYYQELAENPDQLLIPAISVYEVFKFLARKEDQKTAYTAVSAMQQGTVIGLSPWLAMEAAQYSLEMSLPMADSIIFATAMAHDCTIWTQDVDFEGLPRVRYFPRQA